MDIKEIFQHRHGLGLTRAQTATAVGVSTGTVSHILERASAAGLSWRLPDGLDDEALRARLHPSVARDAGCVQPDWEAMLAELDRKRRRTRVTRRQLWVEYRDEARAQGAAPYSYSRFRVRRNPQSRHGSRRSVGIADFIPVSAAVAWVGAHPTVTAPIIGAPNVERLRASLHSVSIDMKLALRTEMSALARAPPPTTDR